MVRAEVLICPRCSATSSDAQALITENAWDFLHRLVSLERQRMYP
jgi:hypothetical protein